MFSRFHEAEIPLMFNWCIIRQDAIQEKANFLDFLIKFNPLTNQYIVVFISMGSSDLSLIYNFILKNKISTKDYYISNDFNYMCDESEFPETPKWLTIFRKDGGLYCDFLSTKSYFLNFEEFKGSFGNQS